MPRVAYALAEQGDLPRVIALVHSRFPDSLCRTVCEDVLHLGFAVSGRFEWNLTLSAVARLFYYGAVCAALPVLRRKQVGEARFEVPAGPVFSALGVIICVALLTQVDFNQIMILAVTMLLAFLNWVWARNKFVQPVNKPAA